MLVETVSESVDEGEQNEREADGRQGNVGKQYGEVKGTHPTYFRKLSIIQDPILVGISKNRFGSGKMVANVRKKEEH